LKNRSLLLSLKLILQIKMRNKMLIPKRKTSNVAFAESITKDKCGNLRNAIMYVACLAGKAG